MMMKIEKRHLNALRTAIKGDRRLYSYNLSLRTRSIDDDIVESIVGLFSEDDKKESANLNDTINNIIKNFNRVRSNYNTVRTFDNLIDCLPQWNDEICFKDEILYLPLFFLTKIVSNDNKENEDDLSFIDNVEFLRCYLFLTGIIKNVHSDYYKESMKMLRDTYWMASDKNNILNILFSIFSSERKRDDVKIEQEIKELLIEFNTDNNIFKLPSSCLFVAYEYFLSKLVNIDYSVDEDKIDEFLKLFESYIKLFYFHSSDLDIDNYDEFAENINKIIYNMRNYLNNNKQFIEINTDVFSANNSSREQYIVYGNSKPSDTFVPTPYGEGGDVTVQVKEKEDKFAYYMNILEKLGFDQQLLDIYVKAYELAGANNNLIIYVKEICDTVNLEYLREINEWLDLYSDAEKDEIAAIVEDELCKLRDELKKLDIKKDKEYKVIYYTEKNGNAENIYINDDIIALKKAGQKLGPLESSLQNIYDANIDGIIANSRPVQGINNYQIFVKSGAVKIIYTVVEYNVGGQLVKKIIVIGCGNSDDVYKEAQQIARTKQFSDFYKAVSEDSDYSQPCSYGESVLSLCTNAKTKRRTD